MSILNISKGLYGVRPVGIEDLNRRATGEYQNRKINHPLLESSLGFKIIPEYEKIRQLLDQGTSVVFVTGNAGTGKTTLVHYLRSVVKRNLVVLAPTGIAALNVGGSTIHSFFHFPPKIMEDSDIKFSYDRKIY